MIIKDKFKILFFGDFVSSKSSDIILSNKLVSLISESDIVGCNLEAPITVQNIGIQKSGIPIKQHHNILNWLNTSGFNLIQLSNNHMFDYGREGLNDTLNNLNNFITVGAGTFEEAYTIKEINIKDKKIGFISFSHYEFGIVDDEDDFGIAWINHPKVIENIRNNRNYFDYIIALPHAGIELIDAPLPEWRAQYKLLIDLGVDAIIATHPHIPQGWEIYNEKPIFYSLGNFFFDATSNPHPFWNKSIAIELVFGEKMEFFIHNLIYTERNINIDTNEDREKHNIYLCELLTNENKYKNYINKEVYRLYDSYEQKIKQSLGTLIFKGNFRQRMRAIVDYLKDKRNYFFLINTYRCESHRWLIQRALELKMKKNE